MCGNNVGISIRHALMDITPQEWRSVMDVNLTRCFLSHSGPPAGCWPVTVVWASI